MTVTCSCARGSLGLAIFLLTTLVQAAASTNVQTIAFPDPRIAVHGLPWFQEDQPVLRRLPARLQSTFRPPVWSLAQSPSGGRLRFRTDSTRIGLAAKNPETGVMHHMTSIGQSGFDVYVDGRYFGSAWPDKEGNIGADWAIGSERAWREITIYLPLYRAVSISSLTLDEGAQLQPARPYRVAKPVVYYGSSITQGGCAENPGLSCQAIVSRWLDADFVNLGFSGNGLGEPELARAICELDPSCIVLDFWANPSFEVYRDRLPEFTDILRARFPRLPILVVSPFYFSSEAAGGNRASPQDQKRAFAKAFVAGRRRAGDRHLQFVDGLKMLNKDQTMGLVDGVHCNSLGFYFNAQGLEPYLRKAIRP